MTVTWTAVWLQIDRVPSSAVFLTQLYCAIEAGDLHPLSQASADELFLCVDSARGRASCGID